MLLATDCRKRQLNRYKAGVEFTGTQTANSNEQTAELSNELSKDRCELANHRQWFFKLFLVCFCLQIVAGYSHIASTLGTT